MIGVKASHPSLRKHFKKAIFVKSQVCNFENKDGTLRVDMKTHKNLRVFVWLSSDYWFCSNAAMLDLLKNSFKWL